MVLYARSDGTTAKTMREIEAGVARKTYVSENPNESRESVMQRLTTLGGCLS